MSAILFVFLFTLLNISSNISIHVNFCNYFANLNIFLFVFVLKCDPGGGAKSLGHFWIKFKRKLLALKDDLEVM